MSANRKKKKPFARLTWDRSQLPPVEPASLRIWSRVFPTDTAQNDEFIGRLILGDNLPVMKALLPEYENRIQLIYADPPFLTGKAYRARIGQDEDSRKPGDWETIASYQDRWRDGAEYLDFLFPRLEMMWRLLAPSGALYLHLDWHASAYARILLDEIFGPDRLMNEIIWVYHGPSPIKSAFNRKHDTILVYTKSKDYTFNVDDVRIPYDESTVKTFASSPRAGFGKKPDLARGKVPEDWWYFPVVARLHNERTGYPTQKPEAMMERMIRASSKPGDIVADFFSGSGTTPSVAARIGRKWIACDPEPTALQVCHRRMISTQAAQPYTIEIPAVEDPMDELDPEISFELRDEDLVVHLNRVLVSGSGEELPEAHIMLWEVDPSYDGVTFKSLHQASRPWRKGTLERELICERNNRDQNKIAVRVLDASGRTGTLVSPVDLS